MANDPFNPHVGTPPRIPGYADGYPNVNGAAEIQSDSMDLDPMLFPNRAEPLIVPWEDGQTFEQMQAARERAEEADERRQYWEGRSFELDNATARGQNIGPRKP